MKRLLLKNVILKINFENTGISSRGEKMIREKILKEFCPQNALELEWDLSKFHRSKGGYGFVKAIEIIQNSIGDSHIISYPSNKVYESWFVPKAWNLKSGFLKIARTGECMVGNLSLSPIRAVFLSGSTDGVERLKVVDVGSGEEEEDYTPSAKNCAVLSNGDPSRVYRLAKKFGIRCVLSYFMRAQEPSYGRTPELLPDAVNYTSFPAQSNVDILGFALSFNQYRRLKFLAKSDLEIETYVDVDEGTKDIKVLEAKIGKRSDKKPLVLTAHVCHPKPGANDNASGSALLAEIVRTLRSVDLDREIVALWIPEMYGTVAYLKDHKMDFEFGINLDMVGENQNLTGSSLDISSTPWSLPSFISELMAVNLENHAFRVKTGRYSGGSDHYIFNDSTVGTPSVSLTQWPDRYYHTNEDTPDKACLESFEWIGNGVLNTIADLVDGMPVESAQKVKAKIFSNFIESESKEEVVKKWMAFRAYKSFDSLSKYTDTGELLDYMKKHVDFNWIPKRIHLKNFKGPLGDSWMKDGDFEWEFRVMKKHPAFRDYKDELLNFMEMGFSFEDSVSMASAEFEISVDLTEESKHFVERLKEEKMII